MRQGQLGNHRHISALFRIGGASIIASICCSMPHPVFLPGSFRLANTDAFAIRCKILSSSAIILKLRQLV